MGTRGMITVYDELDRVVCRIYKQFDSHPWVLGNSIWHFIKSRELVNGWSDSTKEFNGAGDLAVRLICHLQEERVADMNKRSMEVRKASELIGDIYLLPEKDMAWLQYGYEVRCSEGADGDGKSQASLYAYYYEDGEPKKFYGLYDASSYHTLASYGQHGDKTERIE